MAAKPSKQWGFLAILTLAISTLAMAHVVKPPPSPKHIRSRKLASSDSNQPSQMDKTEACASGCGDKSGGDGIYGQGYGSGGTTFGFHNLFPFPAFPFGVIVPEVTTWGEGGGYGSGSNINPAGMGMGMGVNCQCKQNGCPRYYVVMDQASFDKLMKRDVGVPNDMAPSPSGGN